MYKRQAFEAKRENWEPIRGDIEFRDVTFRYPDGSEDVLSHFNLKIPAGSPIAIVGETGAGKSTLVNLACRFFEPTSGQVLIDGRDYRERSQLWLHSSIGYVLQSPHLFSGTVMENIRYGRLDATDEEVIAAAKAVSADPVAAKLEKGYESDVGEEMCIRDRFVKNAWFRPLSCKKRANCTGPIRMKVIRHTKEKLSPYRRGQKGVPPKKESAPERRSGALCVSGGM